MNLNRTIIALSLIISATEIFAQSSPIKPYSDPNALKEIGVFVGLGQNFQSGEMYVKCEDCDFSGGAKFGYTFGLLYEHELFRRFSLGISATYNYLGLTSGFQEIEPTQVEYISNGNTLTENANIRFSHSIEIDLHNFAVAPYLKWTPFDFMFIRTGFAIGTNFSTNLLHTKTLGQKTVRLSNGELEAITNKKLDETIQNSEIPSLVTPQLYLQPALGFNIAFSNSVHFSPIFEYSIPFTNYSDYGTDLRSNYWRLLFELRIKVSQDE